MFQYKRVKASCLLAIFLFTSFFLLNVSFASSSDRVIRVFAAASLSQALDELSSIYQKKTGIQVVSSYASSSTLAKQISSGAEVDIFISANTEWLDYLKVKKLTLSKDAILLSNRLVLVGLKTALFPTINLHEVKSLLAALGPGERLAMGDPLHVPAGIYGKEAFTFFGYWDELKERIAPAKDVRSALRFVLIGECPLGVVYLSDAYSEEKVHVLARFPEASHSPILYPAALLQGKNAISQDFYEFLFSDEAAAVFEQYGFLRYR